jgi:multicomponent Na+:H+ antiporter subunit C
MNIDSILSFITVLIGVYGLATSDNIIKSIVSLSLTQTSIILFFLSFTGYLGDEVPILTGTFNISNMVDPLPQALMITAIVIGASITSLALMLSIKIFHYYGTLNWKELIERKG